MRPARKHKPDAYLSQQSSPEKNHAILCYGFDSNNAIDILFVCDQETHTLQRIHTRHRNIKLPMQENRFRQVDPHLVKCLPLAFICSHGESWAELVGKCRRVNWMGWWMSFVSDISLMRGMTTSRPACAPVAMVATMTLVRMSFMIRRVPFVNPCLGFNVSP
jgi:hypothetical protein